MHLPVHRISKFVHDCATRLHFLICVLHDLRAVNCTGAHDSSYKARIHKNSSTQRMVSALRWISGGLLVLALCLSALPAVKAPPIVREFTWIKGAPSVLYPC